MIRLLSTLYIFEFLYMLMFLSVTNSSLVLGKYSHMCLAMLELSKMNNTLYLDMIIDPLSNEKYCHVLILASDNPTRTLSPKRIPTISNLEIHHNCLYHLRHIVLGATVAMASKLHIHPLQLQYVH